MSNDQRARLAILYPGDRASRDRSDPAESRFADLFEAFSAAGVAVEPAIYHDDFAPEVLAQIGRVDGVLVWHNPIEGGRDRSTLDALLRQAAAQGVFVSTHPDVILKLGTKDVLLSVRDLPFGSDVHRVDSLEQLRTVLPGRLAEGPRVLKQRRGQSGDGIWRVEKQGRDRYAIRHAQRGAAEEVVDFSGVVQRLAPYFERDGYMIEQAWQPRMVEGMTRAYLVGDRVAGFGHQAINALYPAAPGQAPPQTTQRLYSGADDPRFQDLRRRLEGGWVRQLSEQVGVSPESLPMLWDTDFLLGQRSDDAVERYVLCEINVSSVSPFPDVAIGLLVDTVRKALTKSRA